MTREEAIQVLQTALTSPFIYGEYADAIGMAIEALQNLSKPINGLQGSDLISRDDALMEARPEYLNPSQQGHEFCNQKWNDAINEYYTRIKTLPSAEPKTGKWEYDPNGMDWNIPAWRCSECGYVASHIGIANKGIGGNPMNWAGSKYCPECGCKIVGAKMNGGDTE